MNTIILAVIAGVVAILAAVMIPLLLEVRRTVAALRLTTEQKLNPAIVELQEMLKSVRQITNNVTVITEDVKQFSGSIQQVGKKISAVNTIIDAVSSSLTIKTLSMNAGVRAALSYFIANLSRKGDRS
jgi:hypothetical protein